MTLLEYGREMLATLNNRAFLILMLAIMILSLATGLVFALNYYISSFFWLLSTKQIGLLMLAGFGTVFIAFLIGPVASRIFGKVKGAIVLFCTGYVISITPLVLGLMGILFHPGMPNLVWILLVFGAVSGAMTIGASIPVTAMIADVVEDSELKTGRRNEGLFFSGNSFLAKAVTGLGLLGSGLLLWAARFPTGAIPGKVDPAIVHHFAFIYLVTITVVYGLGIVVLSMFPITRETHEANLKTLAAEMAQTQEPVDMGVIR
jgi:Na+/melibiose symporter-like transporter